MFVSYYVASLYMLHSQTDDLHVVNIHLKRLIKKTSKLGFHAMLPYFVAIVYLMALHYSLWHDCITSTQWSL